MARLMARPAISSFFFSRCSSQATTAITAGAKAGAAQLALALLFIACIETTAHSGRANQSNRRVLSSRQLSRARTSSNAKTLPSTGPKAIHWAAQNSPSDARPPPDVRFKVMSAVCFRVGKSWVKFQTMFGDSISSASPAASQGLAVARRAR